MPFPLLSPNGIMNKIVTCAQRRVSFMSIEHCIRVKVNKNKIPLFFSAQSKQEKREFTERHSLNEVWTTWKRMEYFGEDKKKMMLKPDWGADGWSALHRGLGRYGRWLWLMILGSPFCFRSNFPRRRSSSYLFIFCIFYSSFVFFKHRPSVSERERDNIRRVYLWKAERERRKGEGRKKKTVKGGLELFPAVGAASARQCQCIN